MNTAGRMVQVIMLFFVCCGNGARISTTGTPGEIVADGEKGNLDGFHFDPKEPLNASSAVIRIESSYLPALEESWLLRRYVVGKGQTRALKVWPDGRESHDRWQKGTIKWMSSEAGVVEIAPIKSNEFGIRASIKGAEYGKTWVAACVEDPIECAVADLSVEDLTPPTFSGAKWARAVSESQVEIGWEAASDNDSPQDRITYEVCISRRNVDCNTRDGVLFRSVPGAGSFLVDNLLEGQRYSFAARARDEEGNLDRNYSIVSARTQSFQTVKRIVAGAVTTCAVLSGGSVRCWGSPISNLADRCGTKPRESLDVTLPFCSPRPIVVPELEQASGIALQEYLCVIQPDQRIKCSGRSFDDNRIHFIQVATIENATRVTGRCALLQSGDVKCWEPIREMDVTAYAIRDLKNVVDLSSSSGHTCALTSDGIIWCWGKNSFGQLGTGDFEDSNQPRTVVGLPIARKIATGNNFSCASLESGGVTCWGGNEHGQIGTRATSPSICSGPSDCGVAPTLVPGMSDSIDVAAGYSFACSLSSQGIVRCWGANNMGQLGAGEDAGRCEGKSTDYAAPCNVAGISQVVSIAAGWEHACALHADGHVSCWGSHGSGQLGDGSPTSKTVEYGTGRYKSTSTIIATSSSPVRVIDLP